MTSSPDDERIDDGQKEDAATTSAPPPSPPVPGWKRILFLLLAVTALAASACSLQRAVASLEYRQLTKRIHAQLAAVLKVEQRGLPGRLDPARLPRILADRTFAREFRATSDAGSDDSGPFVPPFAYQVDTGLAAFADTLHEASSLRALYLAERGRYALSPDKRALRQAILLFLEQIAAAPLDTLAHFELALAADALADLEDDRPEPQRLERAERLRNIAALAMHRAILLAAAPSSYDVPYISNLYVNLVAGSFFTALHRDASAAGDRETATADLDLAGRAFRNALTYDSGKHHVEFVLNTLRDQSHGAEDTRSVDWPRVAEIFAGTHQSARLILAHEMLAVSGEHQLEERMESAERLIHGLLSDRSTNRAMRDSAGLALIKHSLLRTDLDSASRALDILLRTAYARDRSLIQSMNLYRRFEQMHIFYEHVSRMQRGGALDFPLLEYACGEAALAVNDTAAALQHLNAFVASQERQSFGRDELRRARLRLAQINWQLGNAQVALTYYRTLWDTDPTNRAVAIGYAQALLETGDRRQARAHIVEILGRWPYDAKIQALSAQLDD